MVSGQGRATEHCLCITAALDSSPCCLLPPACVAHNCAHALTTHLTSHTPRCATRRPAPITPHPRPTSATAGDKPYVTDNSNYIVDLYFETPIVDSHAGVVQCGAVRRFAVCSAVAPAGKLP